MLVPQAGGYATGPGISFAVHQPVAHYYSVPTTSNAAAGPSTPVPAPRTSFKAPAHKHAHHLHSIPPREKSTRTLILDHMLWVHGRTRFAQARAELGMTDRTGGPSSPNYGHRRRPENYEEEAEENSEGEDVVKLKARLGDPHKPHENDEDDRMKFQDISLARALRVRAEGLEKVVNSMLVQLPPTVHPLDDEGNWMPPDSPRINPSNQTIRHQHTLPNGNHRQLPTISPRTRSFYNAGADPDTANSPPSLRCPRHLHTGCEICVEAKTPAPGTQGRGRSTSFNDYRSTQNNAWKGMPGGVGPGGGGITGWQDGSGIGSGLLRSGIRGNCLRRKSSECEDAGRASGSGSGNTKLSELIPRFIRLSALVAVEMAMEAKDEQEAENAVSREDVQFDVSDQEWAQMQQQRQGGFSPLPMPMSPATVRAVVNSQDGSSDLALRPTREWYLLLGGLLTRAVLEGYLTAGWRGPQAVECLLTVGLGTGDNLPTEEEEPDEFEEFNPDGLPSFKEAMKLLFPSHSSQRKSQGEEEFVLEMRDRLRQFYDIPASTPDLSTHMEDLAWQYPAEPVERAALRFCEAIARWRGKPELETRPRRKPSIDVYFSPPSSSFQDTSWNPNKRRRSPEATRPSPSKRPNLG
ncbi:hypothetical protein H0H87_007980 [Tephrocybe sp. NHM501043]|nr:hypothetical protein H0H87_007980 [Tephrocybe sp. NHM501043]